MNVEIIVNNENCTNEKVIYHSHRIVNMLGSLFTKHHLCKRLLQKGRDLCALVPENNAK